VAEALECLGGNGYVEECVLPRLYREAPVNSVWEGSGNIMCLDVLRALTRERESVEAFFDELGLAAGHDRRLDAFVDSVRNELNRREEVEAAARRIVERLALALEASLLVRAGQPAVADVFIASRLAGEHGLAFGTLAPGRDLKAILERARPAI
jgi:putative acyl-CoA dehydrogenase